MLRTILVFAALYGITFMQQFAEASTCRAHDLLVYNMALAQMQASSFRQQKPVYLQVPEGVKHHRTQQGYYVSVNVFAITNPVPLAPEQFQQRLAAASPNDFVRINFRVGSAPGQPCMKVEPATLDVTQASTLGWLDIPAKKNIVNSL